MPGFSQESYDRMHGFDFQDVCNNIQRISSDVRSSHPGTRVSVVYHLYRFNISEVSRALGFCTNLGISFEVYCANLTGITMPVYETAWRDIGKDLLMEHRDEIRNNPEANHWVCPQYSNLVLDEYSNVVQCCVAERSVPHYVIDNLRNVDFDSLNELRQNAPVCRLCQRLKIGYLAHNIGQNVLKLLEQK
jgi:hypothetical protein